MRSSVPSPRTTQDRLFQDTCPGTPDRVDNPQGSPRPSLSQLCQYPSPYAVPASLASPGKAGGQAGLVQDCPTLSPPEMDMGQQPRKYLLKKCGAGSNPWAGAWLLGDRGRRWGSPNFCQDTTASLSFRSTLGSSQV